MAGHNRSNKTDAGMCCHVCPVLYNQGKCVHKHDSSFMLVGMNDVRGDTVNYDLVAARHQQACQWSMSLLIVIAVVLCCPDSVFLEVYSQMWLMFILM